MKMKTISLIFIWRSSNAHSVPVVARPFIEISNALTHSVDNKLPSSFVAAWSTWVLDDDEALEKIPDSHGFVDPASIDEIWHPIDLKPPDVHLALGLHVRDGVIRHLMPALDLSYNGHHRNRGLCSVPRAFAWTDFKGIAVDEWSELRLTLSRKKKQETDWEEMISEVSIGKPLVDAVKVLTDQPPEELGDGSHIVNVVLKNAPIGVECIKNRSVIRVTLQRQNDTLPLGVLQVQISATSAGSESEYLPDCYKPLYQDETFRRELFAKFKQRESKRTGK